MQGIKTSVNFSYYLNISRYLKGGAAAIMTCRGFVHSFDVSEISWTQWIICMWAVVEPCWQKNQVLQWQTSNSEYGRFYVKMNKVVKIHHIFFCLCILFVHSKLISFFLFLFRKTLGCAYEPTLISDLGFLYLLIYRMWSKLLFTKTVKKSVMSWAVSFKIAKPRSTPWSSLIPTAAPQIMVYFSNFKHNFKNFLKFLNQQSYFVPHFANCQSASYSLVSFSICFLFLSDAISILLFFYHIVLWPFSCGKKWGDMKVILKLQGQILQS